MDWGIRGEPEQAFPQLSSAEIHIPIQMETALLLFKIMKQSTAHLHNVGCLPPIR
jgi:hypothetical protein